MAWKSEYALADHDSGAFGSSRLSTWWEGQYADPACARWGQRVSDRRRRPWTFLVGVPTQPFVIECMNDARLWHPWLRINRILRVMLQTRWSGEACLVVRVEFRRALALRTEIQRAGCFN